MTRHPPDPSPANTWAQIDECVVPRGVVGIYAFGWVEDDGKLVETVYLGRARCADTSCIASRFSSHVRGRGNPLVADLVRTDRGRCCFLYSPAGFGRDPAEMERRLLREFVDRYGSLPRGNARLERNPLNSGQLRARLRLKKEDSDRLSLAGRLACLFFAGVFGGAMAAALGRL